MNQYVQAISMLAIFIVFYVFFIFLPEKKKRKNLESLRSNLKTGDAIITIGGFVGRVVSVKDDVVTFECGADKTKLKVMNWAIRSVEDTSEG